MVFSSFCRLISATLGVYVITYLRNNANTTSDQPQPQHPMQVGKTAQNAIAVMSFLAECHRDKTGLVSSQTVADARRLSKPLAAKILTTLSQAGYVKGATGPGGGYALAKDPETIRFIDVVSCFEVKTQIMQCPFGEGWCGNHDPCPMHYDILEMTKEMHSFLEKNHFGIFSESTSSSKRDPEED